MSRVKGRELSWRETETEVRKIVRKAASIDYVRFSFHFFDPLSPWSDFLYEGILFSSYWLAKFLGIPSPSYDLT